MESPKLNSNSGGCELSSCSFSQACLSPFVSGGTAGYPTVTAVCLAMSLSEDQQGTTAELCPLEYYKNITFVGILGKIKYAILEFRKKNLNPFFELVLKM